MQTEASTKRGLVNVSGKALAADSLHRIPAANALPLTLVQKDSRELNLLTEPSVQHTNAHEKSPAETNEGARPDPK